MLINKSKIIHGQENKSIIRNKDYKTLLFSNRKIPIK